MFKYWHTPVLVMLIHGAAVLAGESVRPGSMPQDYEAVRARIAVLSEARDLAGLQQIADRIQAEWSGRDASLYGRLILSIVGELNSRQFDNEVQAIALARKYARSALKEADRLPVGVEADLVLYLRGELVASAKQGNAAERARVAALWLHAWKRVADAVDPTWDPVKDAPQAVEWPKVGRGGSGMSPDAIEDPVLRHRYLAAVAENRRKSERQVQQEDARKLKRSFSPMAENAIVEAYSMQPTKLEELEALLQQYVPEQATRDRIMAQVRRREAH